MSKKDVLEEISLAEKKITETAIDISVDKIERDIACGTIAGLAIAKGFVNKMDEPRQPVVPTCAEPWLEQAQCSTDVIDLFSEVEYATDSDGFISKHWRWSPEFYDWLCDDADTLYMLCDALRYGYKVKMEITSDLVQVCNLYLKEPLGDTSDATIAMTWDKERAYRFDKHSVAEEHAKKFSGVVVPETVEVIEG